jgi:hypothetical protein
LFLSLKVQLTLETRIANGSFASDRKTAKMDEWDVQEHQAPDDVPVGVAEELVIPEMVQVMRWIGFDEVKAGRQTTISGQIQTHTKARSNADH